VSYIFFNGKMVPEDQACLSVMDRGLLYGDGFFETILGVNGKPELLHEHLVRLDRSCRQFHIEFNCDDVDWDARISSLLEANNLLQGLSAIKIIVTRGVTAPGLNFSSEATPTVIILAHPYTHPSELQHERGFRLIVFPPPHSSPLAQHKTLNYLYYLTARDYAIERGADEAIILDPGRKVLECATANIFYRSNNTVVKPPAEAPYLKGIIEQRILQLLEQSDYAVREEYFDVDRLLNADEVFISNSLIRIMPVTQVEGKSCNKNYRTTAYLGSKLSGNP